MGLALLEPEDRVKFGKSGYLVGQNFPHAACMSGTCFGVFGYLVSVCNYTLINIIQAVDSTH